MSSTKPAASTAHEHVHGPGCDHDHEHDHHHEAQVPFQRATPKLGRNDPCYCASGKKYKKCHGANDAGAAP